MGWTELQAIAIVLIALGVVYGLLLRRHKVTVETAPSNGPTTVRCLGEVTDLLIERRRRNRWGYRVPGGVRAYEMSDGRLRLTAANWDALPLGVKLCGIVYRAADDRFGVGTRGEKAGHQFQRPFPTLERRDRHHVVAVGGNYQVGPAGIVG